MAFMMSIPIMVSCAVLYGANSKKPLPNPNRQSPWARCARAMTKCSQPRALNAWSAALPVRLSVGDYVKLRQLDTKTGMIEEILPRQSVLSRKDASSKENRVIEQTMLANLDQVVLVFATTQPEPHFRML